MPEENEFQPEELTEEEKELARIFYLVALDVMPKHLKISGQVNRPFKDS